uniref:Uncharacterized protein n=1 Tax=uncultured prokaryote TaxID=198431 RepID=A0A0H5QG43_9ZZZZ|nr:hypothetical protein [uncultured prokaryote]
MNNFNMKRFGQVLKLDIYQNSRTYLNMAAGCFIAHLLSQLACFYVAKLNLAVTVYSALAQEHNQHSAMTASLVVCCLITFFSFLLGASLLWNNLGTKEQRITYLMLPATNLEKYLSRLLLCTVGMLGINAVAFFAADVLRMLAYVNGHELDSAKPDSAGYMTIDREWRTGDEIFIAFDLSPQYLRRTDAQGRALRGQLALQCGPLLYAVTTDLDGCYFSANTLPQVRPGESAGGSNALSGYAFRHAGTPQDAEAPRVPYVALPYREVQQGSVWVTEMK